MTDPRHLYNFVCEFCHNDPYEYVDIGVGSVPVAVVCCDLGYLAYGMGAHGADSINIEHIRRFEYLLSVHGDYDHPIVERYSKMMVGLNDKRLEKLEEQARNEELWNQENQDDNDSYAARWMMEGDF